MHSLVCFDIVNDKKRTKVGHTLLGYGYRVQKSVFEGFISKTDFKEMKVKIEKIINLKEDSVRYYFICEDCAKKIEISGIGIPIEKTGYVIL